MNTTTIILIVVAVIVVILIFVGIAVAFVMYTKKNKKNVEAIAQKSKQSGPTTASEQSSIERVASAFGK